MTPRPETPSAAAIPRVAAVFFCALACLSPGTAEAGAWPIARGETQLIVKYEPQAADQGFDIDGQVRDLDHREEQTASIFLEHGLTDRLTVQAKAGVVRGGDRALSYKGRGPIEAGLRYTVLERGGTTASLYLGAAQAGAGRNAGHAAPGEGQADLEARLLVGRSARSPWGEAFVDLQIARLQRSGLADETHLDATLGVRPARDWLIMAQTYAGQADTRPSPSRWLKGELSMVRSLGTWSLQAGWRETLTGQATTRDRGVVLGVWCRF